MPLRRWMVPSGSTITTIVDDPVYLAIPFVTTTDYKREVDDSDWNPEPCSAY